MRQIIVSLGFFAFMANAHSQVGPASARVVSRQMPSKAPSIQAFAAEAELLVTRKGRVDFVKIVTGSGDEAFDKQWKKSLSDWRFVPAVDDAGQPYESTILVSYKPNGITYRPGPPPAGSPEVAVGTPLDDNARLEKMTCKDFIWEYEIVSDAMPRRLALMDPLLKASQSMAVAQTTLNEPQLRTLHDRYDQIVGEAARHCRDNPDDPYLKSALIPALETGLAAQ